MNKKMMTLIALFGVLVGNNVLCSQRMWDGNDFSDMMDLDVIPPKKTRLAFDGSFKEDLTFSKGFCCEQKSNENFESQSMMSPEEIDFSGNNRFDEDAMDTSVNDQDINPRFKRDGKTNQNQFVKDFSSKLKNIYPPKEGWTVYEDECLVLEPDNNFMVFPFLKKIGSFVKVGFIPPFNKNDAIDHFKIRPSDKKPLSMFSSKEEYERVRANYLRVRKWYEIAKGRV